MDENRVAVEHDLIGVADAGFGDQAFCSCGWRTSPKETSWEARTVWHAHMVRRSSMALSLAS